MTHIVQFRLLADSREDLEAAVARLNAAGVAIRVERPRSLGRRGDWLAYGALSLYDDPETAGNKIADARAIVDRSLTAFVG